MRRDDDRLERAASVAYLIALGSTVADAAESVGVARRTVQRWKADTKLWTEAERLAHERWLAGVTAKAKERIAERLASGDVSDDLLKWASERLIEEMAAPAVNVQANVNHRVSGKVDHKISARDRLAEKIKSIREHRREIAETGGVPGHRPALPPGDNNNREDTHADADD